MRLATNLFEDHTPDCAHRFEDEIVWWCYLAINARELVSIGRVSIYKSKGSSRTQVDLAFCQRVARRIPPERHMLGPRPCFEDLFAGRIKHARQYDRVCVPINHDLGVGGYLVL